MALQGLYDCFSHWGGNNATFILGDCHFKEQDLKDAYPQRPSDEELVKRINSKAGKGSTLIILGDVGDVSYIRQLRASQKILILGNHDYGATKYKRQIITKEFDSNFYSKQEAIKTMEKLYPDWKISCKLEHNSYWEVIADNCLFDEVYSGVLAISEKLILSHEPISNCPWIFNIHSHVHDIHAKDDDYHFNFNIDSKQHYEPWNFNQWLREGHTAKIQTLHRKIIDTASIRKRKRK